MIQIIEPKNDIILPDNKIDLNKHNISLYDSLADKYVFNAKNTERQNANSQKAKLLKQLAPWNNLLEVGVWAGIMNKILWNAGFQTMWIDISKEMLKNAKKLHPKGVFEEWDFLDIHFGEK